MRCHSEALWLSVPQSDSRMASAPWAQAVASEVPQPPGPLPAQAKPSMQEVLSEMGYKLDTKMRQAAAKEAELQARESGLKSKEDSVRAKEVELYHSIEFVNLRCNEVLQTESEVLQKKASALATEAVLRDDLRNKEALETQLKEKETVLAAKELSLTTLQAVLQAKDEGFDVLKDREDKLVQQEKTLKDREDKLDQWGKNLEEWKGQLHERDAKVANREKELDDAEKNLTAKEQQLLSKEQSLDDREDKVIIEEEAQKVREDTLRQNMQQFNEKVGFLKTKEGMLKRRGVEEAETQPASAEADSDGAKMCVKAKAEVPPSYVLSDSGRALQSHLAARGLQPKAKVLPKARAPYVPYQPRCPPPKELFKSSGSQADAALERQGEEEEEEEGASNTAHGWQSSPSWEEQGWDWNDASSLRWEEGWTNNKKHRSE